MEPRIILFILSLHLTSLPLRAQIDYNQAFDTVKLDKGSKLIIGRDKYTAQTDTFIILPSGTEYKLRLSREASSENFFDSLEVRATRKRWTSKLHNVVITAPKKEAILDTLQTSESISPFLLFGGKTIRSITIQQLQPFGPTIHDTSRIVTSSLERFGNNLHNQTHEIVIRNYLLFREGDRLNPSIISDNERIIRQLSFIEDARIYINEVPGQPEFVDIIVLAKDAFSIGLGGNLKDWDAGNIELFEKNFAGLGHQIHTIWHWNAEKSPWLGYDFFYIINNINRSFINNKIRYAKIFEEETYQITFDRRFITPSTKYAGALDLRRTQDLHYISYNDTLKLPTEISYNLSDIWFGRSFALTSIRKYTPNRINLVLATRLQRIHYFKRPTVTENTFYDYHNRTLWLTSISLSQQQFYRSNLIYSFGRTEDIPQGTLLNFVFGPEYDEFTRRFYTGISLSRGELLANYGYLYTKAEFGAFVSKGFFPDQGILHLEANYFSNLYIINRFKIRHFLNVQYVKGYNRFSDEYIFINGDDGIRGYKNDEVKGTRKATMNYEAVIFSPYYFYGFRFVFSGFLDLGVISSSEPLLIQKIHSGCGLSIRIRNERLVFETLSIRIGYYPTLADDQSPLMLDISGEKRLNPEHFRVNKPDVIRFN
ncbi:MAG: hypothetical protein AMS27_00875 [Bacteroides sp. SM23_62_1]|nr:MAG: hypothetical protein AMS27_00875 [Bacteroides sp. SM23_62_1]